MANNMTASDVQLASIVVVIVLSVLCAASLLILLRTIRLSRSRVVRVLAAFFVVVVVVAPVGVLDAALMMWNGTSGTGRVMIDPGWFMKLTPGVVAALVAWALNVRRGRYADGTSSG